MLHALDGATVVDHLISILDRVSSDRLRAFLALSLSRDPTVCGPCGVDITWATLGKR